MHILNFSHPLTADHLARIEALAGLKVSAVQDIRVQFDPAADFVSQVVALVNGLNISPEAWQTAGYLIVLPSLNYIAAVLLAELHGRMGRFPAILRQRPVADALVTTYEVAEIINLDTVRNAARTRR